ncbi:HAD domain-containing protein [Caballeronia sp. ATUFL_M2_KS44]|uniref:HAD domain-containing protein n=1 Tax=Caballeronia sp. ATUFL_M2_KS44 TaxID=2921767 RepID=UPI0032EC9B97
MGGNVVYADFDGMVHPAYVFWIRGVGPCLMNTPGHLLFENCSLLEREFEPYSDLRVVLSTSWAVHYRGSVRRLAARLGPALGRRVVGATFHSRMDAAEFQSTPRGLQVWSDVCRRRPKSWFALDDDGDGWPSWCRSRLVLTDPVLGISDARARAELRFRLQEMYSSP